MQEVSPGAQFNPIDLTAEIVAAYVANNSVPTADLPSLIGTVHAALDRMSNPAVAEAPKVEDLKPAVPVKKSVTSEFIICLDDGKMFKSLKRHLTILGMTPQQYREKWNLPKDYPMVAPAYAAQRSKLATSIGLGQNRRRHAVAADAASLEQTIKPKRARAKKAA